ncbi:MAG: RluA family pseudouridine synthase [Lachnospiraceae bacterium]|nr:RluA family pseudouridine synthase [Lachnospiraceae bacterium]
MKEFVISESDEGRRLDKFVMNILKNAGSSFVYKMLRKKNIVLNGAKAGGAEQIRRGDVVRIYLSDETFDKFSGPAREDTDDLSGMMPPVIYEDEDVLIVDKPSGMLTQRSSASDISLNEICLSYVRKGLPEGVTENASFTPSVCNRLDRNTSGLVTFAKTYRGARALSNAFRDHSFGKYYRCIALGKVEDREIRGRISKDPKTNTVTVSDDEGAGDKIQTVIKRISGNETLTYCEIRLITGKTHQIRAHLAHIGHPILGDPKYGDRIVNEEYRKKYGIRSQMLICNRLTVPVDFPLVSLAGRTIETGVPAIFDKVI